VIRERRQRNPVMTVSPEDDNEQDDEVDNIGMQIEELSPPGDKDNDPARR